MQRGLDYATLQAHGLLEPVLVQHAAFIDSPVPRAVSPPPEPESAMQLVKNEAGRWELQRALGEPEPPVAMKRPGAEQAATIRKRKACVLVFVFAFASPRLTLPPDAVAAPQLEAQVEARVAAPGSVLDLQRVAGVAASERDAEAAARARFKERRLADLAKARRSTPARR
jgi:hypothetical protein